jgi:hypothetical protein
VARALEADRDAGDVAQQVALVDRARRLAGDAAKHAALCHAVGAARQRLARGRLLAGGLGGRRV